MDPKNGQLLLKDVLTVPEGVSAQFRPETVGVYYYDPGNVDGYFTGAPMEISRYEVNYEPDAYTITFTLPDQVACVVIYEYEVNRGSAAGSVKCLQPCQPKRPDRYQFRFQHHH